MQPGVDELPKECISYVKRVVNRAAKAIKKLPNMELTARPLCITGNDYNTVNHDRSGTFTFNRTHLYAPSPPRQLIGSGYN